VSGPDITLKTIDGRTIDLSKLYGHKPVYLKFWATWCVPCREQMPGFERDYETFGDRIAFIAVNAAFNDTEAAVRQVQREAGMRMPIVIDDGRLAADLNLRVTPQHVVIGRDGHILYIGHLADARLHDAMEAALAEAPRSASGREIRGRAVFGVGDTPRDLTAVTMTGEAFPLVGPSPDARPRALVFFSPWCESYLAKSRPADARGPAVGSVKKRTTSRCGTTRAGSEYPRACGPRRRIWRTTRRSREHTCRSRSMSAVACSARSAFAMFQPWWCSTRRAESRPSSAQTIVDSRRRCTHSSRPRQPRDRYPQAGSRTFRSACSSASS